MILSMSSGTFLSFAEIFSHLFSRLVKNIRLQDSSTANLLTKEWDFNIAEKDAEFKDDLRAASGIGRTRNKVLSRRLRLFELTHD